MSVPLTAHGKQVGILSLVSNDSSQFADEEKDILAAAGRQIGNAIETARLRQQESHLMVLQEEGLVRALKQRLKAVESRSGIDHEFSYEGDLDLPPSMEEALYHISQEALNNSLKHARAKKVIVRLACNEQQVEMVISDDGRGFDTETAVTSNGIGLKNMRERAEAFNGTVTLQSEPEQGTIVSVVLPRQSE